MKLVGLFGEATGGLLLVRWLALYYQDSDSGLTQCYWQMVYVAMDTLLLRR